MSGGEKKERREGRLYFLKQWWFWQRLGIIIGGVVTFVLWFSQTPFFEPAWKGIFGPTAEVEAERKAMVIEGFEDVNEGKLTGDISDLDDKLFCPGEQAREWAEGEVEEGGKPIDMLDFKHGLGRMGPDMWVMGVKEGMTYTYKIWFAEDCIRDIRPTEERGF